MRRMEDTMTMQALTGEIELCMSQWLDEANEALAAGKINGYQRVQERITTLLELRTQLVSIPPEDVKTDFPPLRKHIIQLIEKSRKMVVGFMVPRNDKGMLADTANTTVMDLLSLHTEMYRDELKHHFGRSVREPIYYYYLEFRGFFLNLCSNLGFGSRFFVQRQQRYQRLAEPAGS